jgi:hypothetical protein
MEKGNSFKIYFTLAILVLATIFMVYTVIGTKIIITDSEFKVTGIFGTKISLEEIKEVKLLNSIPKSRRIIGMDLFTIKIGTYYVDDFGKSKYYVTKKELPYLIIVGNDKTIIIGESTEENTQYYQKLIELIGEN